MKYVLDTNVVSALRVRGRHPSVEAWAGSIPIADLYVTALTIAEIERGIVAKERTDPAQGKVLRRWFDDQVLPSFAGQILAFDLAAARILAGYRVPEHAPYDDALMAAVAQANNMTIATRNTKHFVPLKVLFVNPWDSATRT